MYDPEHNLMMERKVRDAHAYMDLVRDAVGEDNPLAGACDLIDEAIDALEGLSGDLDDCFEEDRKEEVKAAARELLAKVRELWGAVEASLGLSDKDS